jgi:hypothetical protein
MPRGKVGLQLLLNAGGEGDPEKGWMMETFWVATAVVENTTKSGSVFILGDERYDSDNTRDASELIEREGRESQIFTIN